MSPVLDTEGNPISACPHTALDIAVAIHDYQLCPVCEHAEVTRLRDALTEIAKGEGRFNRDQLTFAQNTIEDMKALAVKALGDQP